MPFLDYTDYERQTNQTLSDPDGRALANAIANGIVHWAEERTGRTFTKGLVTDYFDGGTDTFDLSASPIDLALPITVSIFNTSTNAYDAYTGTLRSFDDGSVILQDSQIRYYRGVKITYTAGFTTLPDDLKQALTELLALKFDAAGDDGGQTIKRVSTSQYSEEYVTSAADIKQVPMDIVEVVDSYRLARIY